MHKWVYMNKAKGIEVVLDNTSISLLSQTWVPCNKDCTYDVHFQKNQFNDLFNDLLPIGSLTS